MANAPWYLKSQTDAATGASLKHHKSVPAYNKDPSKLESRFERGTKAVRSTFALARRPDRSLDLEM